RSGAPSPVEYCPTDRTARKRPRTPDPIRETPAASLLGRLPPEQPLEESRHSREGGERAIGDELAQPLHQAGAGGYRSRAADDQGGQPVLRHAVALAKLGVAFARLEVEAAKGGLEFLYVGVEGIGFSHQGSAHDAASAKEADGIVHDELSV